MVNFLFLIYSLCALLFNHSVPNEQQGPVGQISCVVSVCSF